MDFVTETVTVRRMETPRDEAARLIRESGATQLEVAQHLTAVVGRRFQHWHVSRMLQGQRKIAADEMDALRKLADDGPALAPAVAEPTTFFEHQDQVPLYSAPSFVDPVLKLDRQSQVGIAPLHPAQRGARGAFAFIMPDDSLGERLRPGEVGYGIRNRQAFPGQACLIELKSGVCTPCLFERRDANTVFGQLLSPKKQVSYPLRDVEGVHAIVGTSFQPV